MTKNITRTNIELPVKDIKFTENNARTHSDEQIDQIVASLKEWGWTNPVLVDETNTLIAGNGRALAAIKSGWATIPAVIISGLSPAQKRALVLADNKLALNAGWDNDLLNLELKSLAEMGFDLDLTGFSNLEIGKIAGVTVMADEDDIPDAPPPVSVLGDIWLLGKHRVGCGDSTDASHIAAVLDGTTPHLMVTDPPYGVEYDPEWRVRAGVNMGTAASGKVLNDDRADWSEAWALFPGNICYVWHGGLHSGEVQASLEANGFKMRAQIIWNKSQMVMSRGDYHWKHEPCWYGVKGTGKWCGDRKQTTIWDIDKPSKSETNHSTQKPIECMRRPMMNCSEPGDIVYDPFLGSGSSIVAAETSNRICYGNELNPTYVDIIVTRWQNLTGKQAVHAVTGKAFNEHRKAA